MNKFLTYGVCFLTLTMLFSCKEKFDDNLSSSDINALVVEAEINDQPGPYMVKLTRTVTFYSNDQVVVRKAEVYVTDELNNRYDFEEKEAGLYFSDSASFRGRTDGTYTLFINTYDSLRYKSSPCTIGQPCRIDSVYFSFPSNIGFQVYGDISFGPDPNMMTKIDASIILGNSVVYDVDDSLGTCVATNEGIITTYFSYPITLNYEPVLKANNDYLKDSKIKNIPFFYFNFPAPKIDYTQYNNEWTTHYIGLRYILIVNAHTISKEAFSFYNDMKNQTSSKNVFFEPTPVQLVGNIVCINDKSKRAYGIFEANSIVKKYIKFYERTFHIKELNKIPDMEIERRRIFKCDDNISVSYFD
jgi:hypothetical protein